MIFAHLKAKDGDPNCFKDWPPHRAGKQFWLGAALSLFLSLAPISSAGPLPDKNFLSPEPFCGPFLPSIMTNLAVIQPEGTRRMVARLSALRKEAEINPQKNPFLSGEMAAFIQRFLNQATNSAQVLDGRLQLANQLLRVGDVSGALHHLDFIDQKGKEWRIRFDSRDQAQLRLLRALCHMRMGEQENCLSNHTSASCLLPISPAGVHKLPMGSRAAIDVLTQHLDRSSHDLRGRWLLNLAYMTLGEWPHKVPPHWLIPAKAFESEYDIKPFPEVAASVGLDVDGLAGGSILEDFDDDGFLDLMVSDWSVKGQLRFFHNNGNGTFNERTIQAGLLGLLGGLNILQTDYNNDGRPDVFILRGAWLGEGGHHPNSLLRNKGDGTFEDVTEQAGLLSFHPTQTATWFDYNGDGWLDVFIGNESYGAEIHPCELFRNNGDGTFTECAAEAGVAFTHFVKGVASGDINNDGRPEIYITTRHTPNILLRNDGPAEPAGSSKSKWKFTNISIQAGVTEPLVSFPTWFFDYDNDGWQDIFVSGYSTRDIGDIAADYLGLPTRGEKPRLYRNNHDGTFADVTPAANLHKVLLTMGCNYGDLDNDGWLDFYLGTGDPEFSTLAPNRMFRNEKGKYFQDVTTSGGFGHLQKGHAISFGDIDNDGDQDIFAKMGGAFPADNYRSALFLNPGHGNHWVTLKLEGVRANRAAIGARIRVIVETPEGDRSIYKTVSTGGSFGGSPLRQEIGLGQAASIRKVEILWPVSNQTQTINGLVMDRFYRIREGEASAIVWNVKSFKLPTTTSPHPQNRQTAAVRPD